MKRNTLNFVVDAASALVVFGLVATGLVIRFVLPPGSGSRRLLAGLGRHDWGDVHFWIVVAGGALLLIHLALHWQWVWVTILRLCGISTSDQTPLRRWRRNVVGVTLVGAAVLLFWGFVWAAQRAVTENSVGGEPVGAAWRGGRGAEDPDADRDEGLIRGSMTLAEAATAGAMPVESLRAALSLPASVSPDDRLGRLGREHGFSMSRVREAIHAYRPPSTQKTPQNK